MNFSILSTYEDSSQAGRSVFCLTLSSERCVSLCYAQGTRLCFVCGKGTHAHLVFRGVSCANNGYT